MPVIKGTVKSDKLTGTDQANQLLGLEGNDTLRALAGDDLLDGGLGRDTLSGGLGHDSYIVDQIGDKVIERPGEGIDSVTASISFTLAFHIENLLLAGSGAINGKGNGLGNRLTGNSANNTLAGEAGDDIIDGGAGNDIIIGGKGADLVTGGRGDDTFRFFGGDFAGRTAATADRIVDFSAGDHIDLSKVDALVAASEAIADGKQSFHFIGHNSFHIHSGRELRWEVSGGNTYIYGSTNGDAIADFAIRLDGVHSLTAADFIL